MLTLISNRVHLTEKEFAFRYYLKLGEDEQLEIDVYEDGTPISFFEK